MYFVSNILRASRAFSLQIGRGRQGGECGDAKPNLTCRAPPGSFTLPQKRADPGLGSVYWHRGWADSIAEAHYG